MMKKKKKKKKKICDVKRKLLVHINVQRGPRPIHRYQNNIIRPILWKI